MTFRFLWTLSFWSRIAVERLRAIGLRLRGSRVGRKVLIARGVRVDRPWTVSLGTRCQVERDVWFKMGADDAALCIGDFSFIGQQVELDITGRVDIGAHVLIAPRVFITDHGHRFEGTAPIADQGCAMRPVRIGDGAWLGHAATILPGVTIGNGAIVGAGAVVTRDVQAFDVVGGVPATVIRSRIAERQ